MGYYNNDRRGYSNNRGYNNRGYNSNFQQRGYNPNYDNRYDDRGYNDRPQYEDQPQQTFKYKSGDRLKLVAMPDIQVSVLRCGREQYECRCYPSLQVEWFYEHELAPIEE